MALVLFSIISYYEKKKKVYVLLTFYSANTWRVFHLSSLVVSWAFDLLIALPALKYTSALALTYICSMVLNSAKVQLDSVVLYWIWYLPKLLGLGWVLCMWNHGATWCSHNEIGGDLVNEQNLTFQTMIILYNIPFMSKLKTWGTVWCTSNPEWFEHVAEWMTIYLIFIFHGREIRNSNCYLDLSFPP